MNPEKSTLPRNLKITEWLDGAAATLLAADSVHSFLSERSPVMAGGYGVASVLMGLAGAIAHKRRVDLDKNQ